MATLTNDKHAVLSVILATTGVALILTAALAVGTAVKRRAAALASCWATHIGPSPYEGGIRAQAYSAGDPCVRDPSGGESR
jgi:hypothetical protein